MLFDSPVDVALAAFLLVWLLISVVCQVTSSVEKWTAGGVERWVRAHDVFGCIPRWHFFAPRPATEDLHLLYRDRLPGGRITRWCEVLPRGPHLLGGAVWNPDKRHNKALIDATHELIKVSASVDGDRDRIQLTISYIALLNFVCCLPRDYTAEGTQFLVMRSKGFDGTRQPTSLILSAMHRADTAPQQRQDAC
jgi:hypothetical protein